MKKKLLISLSVITALSIIAFGFILSYFIVYFKDFLSLLERGMDWSNPYASIWVFNVVKFFISLFCLLAIIILGIYIILLIAKKDLSELLNSTLGDKFAKSKETRKAKKLAKAKKKVEKLEKKDS